VSYLRHSASTLATQVIGMVIGVASGILVARVLGPELKGQAVLLTLIIQMFSMFLNMGMGSAFSFFIAKNRYAPQQILTCALVCSLVFGGFGILAFYVSWPLHAGIWKSIPNHFILIANLLGLVSIYITYLTRIQVGYGHIYNMNIADLAKGSVGLIASVLLMWVFPRKISGYMEATVLCAVAQMAVLLWDLRKDLKLKRFWNDTLIRNAFSYGIKSHALLLINFLNYRIDMLFLKHFTDDAAVGIYSLAVGMAEIMWLVPNATVAPLFGEIASSENPDRSIVTLRTCRWSLIFLVFLALGGVLLGRPFIRILYGADFLSAYIPFLLILPGVCIFPIAKLLGVDLAARGFPGYTTIASAIALITNISSNLILIPRIGIAGASLSSAISYSLMSIICFIFFKRVTGHGLKDLVTFDQVELSTIQRCYGRLLFLISKK
jgi:O-antigen/teichoic acid export membrane protein